jgi:site-specific DNA recombinase
MRHSLWRRSSWRRISAIRRGALSRHPYYKECWCASSVVTRSIGVLRGPPSRNFTITRCIGSDAYRHLCGPVCTNPPIRQDYLDQFVWQEIIGVLEKPELIQAEIQRRLEAAQKSDPVLKREHSLRRELTRLETSTERLLTAYQEGLLTLAELRRRMPELRKQQQAIQSELTSMELAASDQSRYLRLTHTLTEFRQRLHAKSETMETTERQKILRLLVKEILVGTDTITFRHSLPIAGSEAPRGSPVDGPRSPGAPSGTPSGASYLLRSGSDFAAAFQHHAA